MTDETARRRSGEALWAVDESNVLLAWDGRTGQVSARVDLGGAGDVRWYPRAGGGFVWMLGSDGSVASVDPVAARLTPLVIEPRPLRGLVGMPYYSHGAMWIWGTDRVWRVTAAGESSAATMARNDRAFGGAAQAAATDRWVFFGQGRQLLRVDPRTGSVADESGRLHAALESAGIPPPGVLDSMTAGPDDLVIAMGYNEPDIVALEPDTMRPKWTTRVPDGSFVVTIYQSGRHIWALSENTAMRLDTRAVGESHLVSLNGMEAASAVVALGSLWFVHRDTEALVRLERRDRSDPRAPRDPRRVLGPTQRPDRGRRAHGLADLPHGRYRRQRLPNQHRRQPDSPANPTPRPRPLMCDRGGGAEVSVRKTRRRSGRRGDGGDLLDEDELPLAAQAVRGHLG